MSYKKEVQNMTDEELNEVFTRQYKEQWLRQNRARKQKAKLQIIGMCMIALIIIATIITMVVRTKLYVTINADTNNDGYYEVITVPKWKVDDYPNRIT